MAAYTVDTLFDPPLTLCQPKTGYRYSLDPLILAAHITPAPKDRILDIGCGCGILSLILAGRNRDVQILGIEIQPVLAGLAQKNAARNRMENRVTILHQDIRTLDLTALPAEADLIVSNPPYLKKAAGRVNPDPGKALARHEITLDINILADRAHFFLRPKGQLCLIFPACRTPDLTTALGLAGFGIQWMRPVYFRCPDTPQRIVVCAVKSDTGAGTRLPPLYLYRADNTPTRDHLALFQW